MQGGGKVRVVECKGGKRLDREWRGRGDTEEGEEEDEGNKQGDRKRYRGQGDGNL